MAHPDRCTYCGSISEGTLKPEDLIPAFVEALGIRLDEVSREQRDRKRSSGELERALEDLEGVELRLEAPGYFESENPEEDLQWLEELLEHYAPPGHWFGAHPGDGAAFGFWPLDILDGAAEDAEPSDDAEDGQALAEGEPSPGPPGRSRRPDAAPFPELSETHAETWFERDRAHVALYDSRTNTVIVEWWDDEVGEALEDGFLDRRDYHRSAYDYARQLAGAGGAG